MRIITILCGLCLLFASCNSGEKTPDVSNVKVTVTTQRFEKELFGLDTADYAPALDKLLAAYPSFGENFLSVVLGADPRWNSDSMAVYVKGFSAAYKNVYDTAMTVFKDFSPYEKEIKNGLQFVKHYFPNYKLPEKIITYIGPLNGYGDILLDDAVVVGLHLHLGSSFSMYQSELVQQTYPAYISNRFEPGYIAVNSLKNIVLDLFPEKMEDKPLVQQMVEKGKRLYLLHKFLPETEEYKLIGYTEDQLKQAYENEKKVWNMFAQNGSLQSMDENIIKNYIGEAPKTQELGDASPGNIGSFAGWQIVKKFMQQNDKTTLQQLMAMDADALFQAAKYKP